MLNIQQLQARYGQSQILFDIDLSLGRGQVVSVLGRNGMGKTTTLKSIMGLMPSYSGQISYQGQTLAHLPSFKISQLGIAYVPEGRRIFPNLNVEENLIATARASSTENAWTLARVLALFPALKPRLKQMGNTLSGGEQQMLAIGRALMLNPDLLILDEATEGLAPLVRQQIWDSLSELKKIDLSILIVDKQIAKLKSLADYHYILEKGHIVWHGNSQKLDADERVILQYIGIQ